MIKTLQKWKAAFRMFQVYPEAFAMYSTKEFKCLYANIHFCNSTGYDLKTLLENDLKYFVYPDDLQKTEIEYKKVVEDQAEIWSDFKHVRRFQNRWIHGKTMKPINMTWHTFDNDDIFICKVKIQ